MPNTKSAIRRVRRVKKQTQVNRIRRSKYKNAIKQMEQLLKMKDKEKGKFFPKFQSIQCRLLNLVSLTKKLHLEKFQRFQKDLNRNKQSLVV